MTEEIKITAGQTKENISIQISVLKSRIRDYINEAAKAKDVEVREMYERKKIEAEDELAELNEELAELGLASKKRARQLISEFLATLDPNTHLAYLASEAKYMMIHNYSKTEERVNLDTRYLSFKPMVGVLNNIIKKPGYFDDVTENDLRVSFERANLSYQIKTASFDEPKWDDVQVFNTMSVQRKFWAPIDRGTGYQTMFDDLMYSLGGGKQENIEHIEKWIGYKYLYPEQCKTMPGLNITGKPGGNGKGMFGVILSSVFTPMGVTTVTSKNFTGGFNAIMEGKVISILDDEKKDGFPNDELKRATGNGSIVIEPKGIDAYSVDTTSTPVVFDNTGLVRLVGGGSAGEDRRWSIITTELTLLDTLQNKYNITAEESKELAKHMGYVFENRIECGKWIAHVIAKYQIQKMEVLSPLHGQDYRDRLNDQKDNYAETFEAILPIVEEQGLIPFKFFKEICEARMGIKFKKTNDLAARFDEFLSRKGHKNVDKAEANIVITMNGAFTGDKIKGRVRRIDADKNSFDYSRISNVAYTKKAVITAETLELHDYTAEIAEKTVDFADRKNRVAESLTPLEDKKPNKINGLQQVERAESKNLDSANTRLDSARSPREKAKSLQELYEQVRRLPIDDRDKDK